jgi:hypothetical protein
MLTLEVKNVLKKSYFTKSKFCIKNAGHLEMAFRRCILSPRLVYTFDIILFFYYINRSFKKNLPTLQRMLS